MVGLQKRIGLLLVGVLAASVLASAPLASAQHDNDDNNENVSSSETGSGATGSSTSGSSGGSSSSGSSTESGSGKRTTTLRKVESEHKETEQESEHTSTVGSEDSLKSQAKDLLEKRREGRKERSVEQRQKACENHKGDIANRRDRYVAAAERHYNVFTDIFTKVQAFQSKKQYSVTNYDQLVAAATAKQAAAQAAIDALKARAATIDCTTTDPASAVATLKAAVQNTKSALQDYRSAVKDVVVALNAAAPDEPTTTGGGQ